MKKLIFGVAFASLVISCKKIQAGGNLGILKVEDGSDRYSEDEMKDAKMPVKEVAVKADSTMAKTDSTKSAGMSVASPKMKNVKIIPATLQSPMREQQ